MSRETGEQWQQTALRKELDSREGSIPVHRTLEASMPAIEAVLNFTLHDADHGFRVANRMADLIGKEALQTLSGFEVALLLLSAYLYDIGNLLQLGRKGSLIREKRKAFSIRRTLKKRAYSYLSRKVRPHQKVSI